MDMESRAKRKELGFVRFVRSFGYSFDGLAYAVKKEQSVLVMVICLTVTISLGIFLNISLTEWYFVLIAIALVLGTELLNTAIEATIDLLSPKYHPLAKIAKDTASASVFIYSLVAFVIGCLVFIPKLLERIQ